MPKAPHFVFAATTVRRDFFLPWSLYPIRVTLAVLLLAPIGWGMGVRMMMAMMRHTLPYARERWPLVFGAIAGLVWCAFVYATIGLWTVYQLRYEFHRAKWMRRAMYVLVLLALPVFVTIAGLFAAAGAAMVDSAKPLVVRDTRQKTAALAQPEHDGSD